MLHEEEVVAEKRVVPKERVRLDKDVEVEERTVSEEVRREEIDVTTPARPPDATAPESRRRMTNRSKSATDEVPT
ncbi:MAG: DUF2382 domain-containing protein [Solirubrobacteraceae bacterium]